MVDNGILNCFTSVETCIDKGEKGWGVFRIKEFHVPIILI